jgi:hypothetical protein
MFEVIQQSESTAARRRGYFHAVDATDGITPETGLTGAARISKNGASTVASSGSIVEIDATNMPGRYYVELTATECDTVGQVVVRYKSAACAEVVAQATIVAYDPNAAGPTANDVADAVLKRDWTVVTGEATRSVLNALRAIRNKVSFSSGTATVTKEDDATTAWTAAVTGTPQVTNVDPS